MVFFKRNEIKCQKLNSKLFSNAKMMLKSGSNCIDSLLGGGIETGTITQIYGASGTGKTSICLMFSYNAAKNWKVAYLDTEGLSGERVKQIFVDESLLNNVFIYEIYDFKQQSVAIKKLSKLCSNDNVKLIVVDCFTSLYRSELEDESKQIKIKRELTSQLTYLLGLARKHDVAVLITNQMYTDVKDSVDKPLGGPSLEHLTKVVIGLERLNKKRRATLIKHRWKAEGESCEFLITNKGIEP